jgi:transposase-like protein
MGQRKRYSQAFKEDAVRVMRARGTRTVTEIAAELHVSPSLLHRWNTVLAPKGAADKPQEEPTEDVEALRRRQVEQENALLKKGASEFHVGLG